MTNPTSKKNIEHIYVMDDATVRSKQCCPKNASITCIPHQYGGQDNLFTAYGSNPYAEFNIFGDPFAAYQVFHSGIPFTHVPLEATNTISITQQFFAEFERPTGNKMRLNTRFNL